MVFALEALEDVPSWCGLLPVPALELASVPVFWPALAHCAEWESEPERRRAWGLPA